MAERITSPVNEPADDSRSASPVIRDQQPLHGPLAAGLGAHQAGIGLGVVGLLIGAIAASPLIAVVGLVGGVAVGTVLLDSRPSRANPLRPDAQKTPDQRRELANARAEQGASTRVARTAAVGDNKTVQPPGIAIDHSFDESEGVTPRPAGKRGPLPREIF